jgi:uncharacterized protein (DUF2249 family)
MCYFPECIRNTLAALAAEQEVCGVATVDARPVIASGGEPFDMIMEAVAALADDEELTVLAPFEPVPLEGVLGSQGFSYDAADVGDGDWRVTFRRQP